VTAQVAAIVTLIVALAVVVVALLISSFRFPVLEAPAATSTIYRVRSCYFVLLLGVVAAVLWLTLPMTPYPASFNGKAPDIRVAVTGEMWSWTMTAEPASGGNGLILPAGKLIEFDVTSKDVNHDFAIYNSSGAVVAQVQAMPNYTNHLFYRFSAPGHYYVLCLEFCGVGHHAMNTEFAVK
jgi:cytochrome c oxidase subunit 2